MSKKVLFAVAFLALAALPSASTTQAQDLIEYPPGLVEYPDEAFFYIVQWTVLQNGAVELEAVEGNAPCFLPREADAEATYSDGMVHLDLKVEGESTEGVLASQVGGFGNVETFEMKSEPVGEGLYEVSMKAEGAIPAAVGDEFAVGVALLPVPNP